MGTILSMLRVKSKSKFFEMAKFSVSDFSEFLDENGPLQIQVINLEEGKNGRCRQLRNMEKVQLN